MENTRKSSYFLKAENTQTILECLHHDSCISRLHLANKIKFYKGKLCFVEPVLFFFFSIFGQQCTFYDDSYTNKTESILCIQLSYEMSPKY